jgi:hypothetical protein
LVLIISGTVQTHTEQRSMSLGDGMLQARKIDVDKTFEVAIDKI